jgi:hypothetical protein
MGLAAPDKIRLPGLEVTVKLVMADPPAFKGGVKLTDAAPLPAVTLRNCYEITLPL